MAPARRLRRRASAVGGFGSSARLCGRRRLRGRLRGVGLAVGLGGRFGLGAAGAADRGRARSGHLRFRGRGAGRSGRVVAGGSVGHGASLSRLDHGTRGRAFFVGRLHRPRRPRRTAEPRLSCAMAAVWSVTRAGTPMDIVIPGGAPQREAHDDRGRDRPDRRVRARGRRRRDVARWLSAARARAGQGVATATATPTRDDDAAPTATPSPTADRHPDAGPTATPLPTPLLVPAPLTGLLVTPGRRGPSPDRGHDRRPRAAATAVRAVAGIRRLAGAGRGRDPALHGDLPGHAAEGDRPGPQLALLLHRVGRRVARRLRPFRRVAAGEGDARRQGPRPVRLQRRRVPLQRDVPSGSPPRRRRTTCTPPARKLRAMGKHLGRQGQDLQAGLAVRARRAARDAAVRRHDHRRLPVQHDQLHVRPHDQHLPPLGDRREQGDRRARRDADRAEERDRHADGLRPAQRRPSRSAAPRGDGRRPRDRPGSRPTAGRSRGPGRRPRSPRRPSSSTRAARRSP